jgi:hypothetical protein
MQFVRDRARPVILLMLVSGLAGCGADDGSWDGARAEDSAAVRAEGGVEESLVPVVAPPKPDARYALLIGIQEYPEGFRKLPGPATDVVEFRNVLVDVYGFLPKNVVTLPKKATRQAILDAITNHLGQAGPDGMALLYFSGHGVQMSRNYSVPDTEKTGTDQALLVWGADGKASVILDDELGHLLRNLNTPRVLFVADACHSGTVSKLQVAAAVDGDSTPPTFFNRSAGKVTGEGAFDIPVRWLSDAAPANAGDIGASSGPYVFFGAAEEQSRAFSVENWPSKGEQHGVFTYFLTRALRSADGTKSARTFFEAVQFQVVNSNGCKKYKRCQTPQIAGDHADQRLMDLLGQR